jgi:hypothetical protein
MVGFMLASSAVHAPWLDAHGANGYNSTLLQCVTLVCLLSPARRSTAEAYEPMLLQVGAEMQHRGWPKRCSFPRLACYAYYPLPPVGPPSDLDQTASATSCC